MEILHDITNNKGIAIALGYFDGIHIGHKKLLTTLKNLRYKVKGLYPLEEAIVTGGGVNVKEINPKTMQSKLIEGLYFAGEVIDVDALTGGFTLQCAFATAYLAGNSNK